MGHRCPTAKVLARLFVSLDRLVQTLPLVPVYAPSPTECRNDDWRVPLLHSQCASHARLGMYSRAWASSRRQTKSSSRAVATSPTPLPRMNSERCRSSSRPGLPQRCSSLAKPQPPARQATLAARTTQKGAPARGGLSVRSRRPNQGQRESYARPWRAAVACPWPRPPCRAATSASSPTMVLPHVVQPLRRHPHLSWPRIFLLNRRRARRTCRLLASGSEESAPRQSPSQTLGFR